MPDPTDLGRAHIGDLRAHGGTAAGVRQRRPPRRESSAGDVPPKRRKRRRKRRREPTDEQKARASERARKRVAKVLDEHAKFDDEVAPLVEAALRISPASNVLELAADKFNDTDDQRSNSCLATTPE